MLWIRPYYAEFSRAKIFGQCTNLIKHNQFGKCCKLNSVMFHVSALKTNVIFKWNVTVHNQKVYLKVDTNCSDVGLALCLFLQ